MPGNPKVNSEKPARPTLWLDTSVIIKLTKVEQGERLQQVEIDRLTHLRDLVRELVPAGKLICPQADQEEEYVAKRLDREIYRDFLGLSLGINMRHRQGIFDWQAQLGMEAYVKKADTIDVSLSAYFHSDPVEELEQAWCPRFASAFGTLTWGFAVLGSETGVRFFSWHVVCDVFTNPDNPTFSASVGGPGAHPFRALCEKVG